MVAVDTTFMSLLNLCWCSIRFCRLCKSTHTIILERLNIIKPAVRMEAEAEIDQFIDWWKLLAAQNKPLRYYVYKTDRYNRLMNYYGEKCIETEKATLSSMREVESASNMYYYLED